MRRLHRARYLRQVLRLPGVGPLLRRTNAWNGVIALNYHRIGNGRDSVFDRGLWSATAEQFDRQVVLLKRHCDLIAPPDLKDVVGRRRGRFALITFDDGYRDNYERAFPILKSHGVKGTFFVTSGFLDRPRLPWWDEIAWMVRTSKRRAVPAGGWLGGDVQLDCPDREQAVRTLLRKYKSIPGSQTESYIEFLAAATGSGRYRGGEGPQLWMTWAMLREMRAAGMCIGGHTVNHPVLARLPAAEQDVEVLGCKSRLEAELAEPMRYFSYPVGGPHAFNDDTRRCLAARGVELAFSYYGSFIRLAGWDAYDVPRVGVEQSTTQVDLTALLALPQLLA